MLIITNNIWNKVFKIGLSESYGWQPLKNLLSTLSTIYLVQYFVPFVICLKSRGNKRKPTKMSDFSLIIFVGISAYWVAFNLFKILIYFKTPFRPAWRNVKLNSELNFCFIAWTLGCFWYEDFWVFLGYFWYEDFWMFLGCFWQELLHCFSIKAFIWTIIRNSNLKMIL